MIQESLRTTTGKLNVQIPSDLRELTLGQMMQLQDCQDLDDLTAISILSGIPAEELKNVKDVNELFTFGETILTLSYQIKHLYNAEEIPKRITFFINDTVKTLNVISNLSVEPAGAFMAAREIIAEEIKESIKTHGEENWQQYFNPSLNACCQVLAHYFFCRVTGKPYNEHEAEDFVNEIKKLRVTEALPIARHFFTCYPSLSKTKISFLQRLLQRLKNVQASRLSTGLNISIP